MAPADQPVLEGVPVIDASQFLAQGNAGMRPPQDVIDQIVDACSSWGFFQLVNHGVSQQLLDVHYAAMKQFFALPLPEKEACKRSKDNSMGYFNDEFTKQKLDLKEGLDFRHTPNPQQPDDHADNYDPQGVNRWPTSYPDFKPINQRYFTEMSRISFRLLEVIATGLGLQPTALHGLFAPSHTSFLRLNYYPVTPGAAPDSLGISPHKDAGFLTVLVQDDVAGLQVLREGVWHLVQPLPGAFTINVGDMAQVATNDKFFASNHRVLQSSSRPRYSRAFFFNPSHSVDIQPLQVEAVGDKVPHYRPINWWEFRSKRYEGDYANVGEEVQIEWYRVEEGVEAH